MHNSIIKCIGFSNFRNQNPRKQRTFSSWTLPLLWTGHAHGRTGSEDDLHTGIIINRNKKNNILALLLFFFSFACHFHTFACIFPTFGCGSVTVKLFVGLLPKLILVTAFHSIYNVRLGVG